MAPATVHQDNMSTIHLLEHESTSERSRHVKIRFYWVRDLVEKKDINIVPTNTEDMIADILTKPLQGEHIRRLRALLLNWHG